MTIVTAWLVVCVTIWETVYMSKCVNTLEMSWVRLIRSTGGFLVSSDIVLEIRLKELKSRVLNTLSKVSASSSTLLSKSEASVNISKQCQRSQDGFPSTIAAWATLLLSGLTLLQTICTKIQAQSSDPTLITQTTARQHWSFGLWGPQRCHYLREALVNQQTRPGVELYKY